MTEVNPRSGSLPKLVMKFTSQRVLLPLPAPTPPTELNRNALQAHYLPIQPIGKTTEIRILEPFDFVVAAHQGRPCRVADEGVPVCPPELPLGLQAALLSLDAGEIWQDVPAENDPVRPQLADEGTGLSKAPPVQVGKDKDSYAGCG